MWQVLNVSRQYNPHTPPFPVFVHHTGAEIAEVLNYGSSPPFSLDDNRMNIVRWASFYCC